MRKKNAVVVLQAGPYLLSLWAETHVYVMQIVLDNMKEDAVYYSDVENDEM